MVTTNKNLETEKKFATGKGWREEKRGVSL